MWDSEEFVVNELEALALVYCMLLRFHRLWHPESRPAPLSSSCYLRGSNIPHFAVCLKTSKSVYFQAPSATHYTYHAIGYQPWRRRRRLSNSPSGAALLTGWSAGETGISFWHTLQAAVQPIVGYIRYRRRGGACSLDTITITCFSGWLAQFAWARAGRASRSARYVHSVASRSLSASKLESCTE